MRVQMAAIMEAYPDETLAGLAQLMKDVERESIRAGGRNLRLPSVRTVENWLSRVRSHQQPAVDRKVLK
jgi:hypothetical protein